MDQRLFVLALVWFFSFAVSAQAKMAISCEFALLMRAHEGLLYCGEQIDHINESRYARLIRKFSTFVTANGGSTMPRESYEADELQKHLRELGPGVVCKDPDYPKLQQSFLFSVSDKGLAAVEKLLSQPQNPDEGDCF